MASETVAQLSADMQRHERDQFSEYLKDRVANAQRICATKRAKGQPLPERLLRPVQETLHVEPSGETPPATKVCRSCKRARQLFLFPVIQQFKDGSRNSVCQLCIDTKAKETKKKAIKDGHAFPPQQLPTIAQRALRMWTAARLRAWRAGVPFCMRKKWVEDRLRAGRCEVTGLPFIDYGRGNFMASIDREVPEKGYTESNCRMTVWLYNAAKGTGTHKDVLRMAKALIEFEKATKKRLAAARAAQAEAHQTGEAKAA